MNTLLRIRQLNKHFANGRHALRDINIDVARGDMVALIGASGSGKSTLLRHIAGLVAADGSSESLVEIDGRCVQKGGRIDRDIRKVRSQVGFVFQQFNLVARLPVLVNVLVGSLHRMPWWRSWMRLFTAQERALALEALARVGIADCYAQRASTLSGGQQQRAAIARTLVQGAKVVLADEPIASLDPESSRKVMEILARINREDGCTVIVSLHQVDIAMKYCPRVVALNQGQVVFDGPSSALTPELLRELYGVQAEELLRPEGTAVVPAPAQPVAGPWAQLPVQVA
ncbi:MULTISPECIES: phosphonate ABC transporter ATP-binding protein [Variovorax]|jgi:phosphonate transport system ATP-binding protein|uniref:phosphonate ABC transporter ATP-binding protein n=1 Tax=Variovorax TaxID=34072 RepID=UPI000869CE56|nr:MULTISPECIES: phosphonate ABC transporter ATP-binding protein [Variovorax]MBN8755438.1 phosphonate ABC transporter ATP-binding protein [Variovorax sp.]ODU14075.1 MAG: phosphonate ABC transporter ATP-binding protein [Variovorax sp. SCN 67-85]ODV22825.1 MAG: phosphonate ABC transporter ATP-binding protein [Variovorax sp. SCN 67-20]OJZ12551.1 MAG: phosphonate ABC transporter ATP-binding protein [Variovorax sp. 67-131]UKI09289.1 phosphonate ABC transporter ATP-binding protein [Variovorax parado